MDNFIRTVSDIFWRAYDWCMEHKKAAAGIGAAALALIILLAAVCCSPRVVDEGSDETHGYTWTYYSDGTLSFGGNGEIVGQDTAFTEEYVSGGDATPAAQPEWYAYRDQVREIEIGRDITFVGMDSFVGFGSLDKVTVRGESTELDIDCIRYEDEKGWENFTQITICAVVDSPAHSYARFSGMDYRPL